MNFTSQTKFAIFYRKSQVPIIPFSDPPAMAMVHDYTEVTTVAAEDLECVFRVMNVVDGSDFEMPRKLGVRSMSTGDIAVNEAGEAFYCASFGWNPVEFK